MYEFVCVRNRGTTFPDMDNTSKPETAAPWPQAAIPAPCSKEQNDHECAGKGNYQCKWERLPKYFSTNTWKDVSQNVGQAICHDP